MPGSAAAAAAVILLLVRDEGGKRQEGNRGCWGGGAQAFCDSNIRRGGHEDWRIAC